MKSFITPIATAVLLLSSLSAIATPPQRLTTHNLTNVESNAFIAGVIASQHPTKARSDNSVSWIEVKMACFGHVINGKCSALIKMETETSHPVNLGVLAVDMNSGEIFPKKLSANGYTLTVNGPGETTLSKD